jgi:hypothetical protein
MHNKTWRTLIAVITLASSVMVRDVFADQIPAGWRAENLEPIGYSDLGGNYGGAKLAIKQKDGHWYIYKAVGNGFAIIEVTDPKEPKLLKTVPHGTGLVTSLSQISIHDDILLAGLSRPITAAESRGDEDNWTTLQAHAPEPKQYAEGVQLWDISSPVEPKLLSHWEGHAAGTHRNVYPGGRYAYLSSTMPGFRGFILVILDISDPAKPAEAARWWFPGQKEGEALGEVTPSYHGPAHVSPDGRMLTTGYTPAVINLDITDITRPKLIGKLTLIPPFLDSLTQSIHTVVPLWDRKLLFASGEPMKRNCKDALTFAALLDNSDPTKPYLLSVLPVPRPTADAPYKDFCDKGGRFGPHNTNTEIHSPDVQKPSDLLYIAYFTAGLRVFDIRNPRLPSEVGWFLPPRPSKPVISQGGFLDDNATQDVLVDTRGNVYISDSAWGLWILMYTGVR